MSGTLPDLAPGAEIQFPDYEEEYRRERPGTILFLQLFSMVLNYEVEENVL